MKPTETKYLLTSTSIKTTDGLLKQRILKDLSYLPFFHFIAKGRGGNCVQTSGNSEYFEDGITFLSF